MQAHSGPCTMGRTHHPPNIYWREGVLIRKPCLDETWIRHQAWKGRERNAESWSLLERQVWVWLPPRAGRKGWGHHSCSAWRCHFCFSPVPLLTQVSSKPSTNLNPTNLSSLLCCCQAAQGDNSTVLGRREGRRVSIICRNVHLFGKTLLGLNFREGSCACYQVITLPY